MENFEIVAPPSQKVAVRFRKKFTKSRQGKCWLWKGARLEKGHGVFHGLEKTRAAHRLALMWRCGKNFTKLWALHRCGVASCVNPDHLYWGTPKQNSADRHLHNTAPLGEKSALAKLKNAQVIDVWNSYHLTDESMKDIEKRTGVSRGNMNVILGQKNWVHLTKTLTPRKLRAYQKTFGSKHWRSSLTEEQVVSIRKRYDAGEKFTGLATEFGMTKGAMWRICKRKSWSHVKD